MRGGASRHLLATPPPRHRLQSPHASAHRATSCRAPTASPHETSLYLKQHANNPVDWYPWGPEALARAKELDRPIFLSIGYSACHWCHVMEHESFEDEATAEVMNEHFVCIKVDREERPDLDTIYMNALQVLTREGGGWPLSRVPDARPDAVLRRHLLPARRPLRARTGRASSKLLAGDPRRLGEPPRPHHARSARTSRSYLKGMSGLEASDTALSPELLSNALAVLRRSFDPTHGGFGSAPKFPHALELRLLLRLAPAVRRPDRAAHGPAHAGRRWPAAACTTSSAAASPATASTRSGSCRTSRRCSTTTRCSRARYVEAWQVTRDPFYEQIARETLDYVLREMTAPGGAFYSHAGRRQRGRGGQVLRLEREGNPRRARPGTGRVRGARCGA